MGSAAGRLHNLVHSPPPPDGCSFFLQLVQSCTQPPLEQEVGAYFGAPLRGASKDWRQQISSAWVDWSTSLSLRSHFLHLNLFTIHSSQPELNVDSC